MQMRRSKALSWFLSLVMALTIFSVPTSIFATEGEPAGDSPTIEKAILHDVAGNIEDKDLYESYGLKQDGNVLSLSATGLRSHENGAGDTGYWAGVAFAPAADQSSVTKFKYATADTEGAVDDAAFSYAASLESNVIGDKSGVAFYKDVSKTDSVWVKFQWCADDGSSVGDVHKYKIDFSDVYIADETSPRVGAATLEDHSASPIVNLYKEGTYSASSDGTVVSVSAEGLKRHKNGNNVAGYWAGAAFAPNEYQKNVTQFKYATATTKSGINTDNLSALMPLEKNVFEGESGVDGVAFYKDVSETDSVWVALEWFDTAGKEVETEGVYVFRIDFSGVEIDDENVQTVAAAKLHDAAGSIKDKDLYEEGSYNLEQDGNVLYLSARGLKLHKNGNNVAGYWVGAAFVPAENQTDAVEFKYAKASSKTALGRADFSSVQQLEKNVIDNKSGLAYYLDAENAENNWIKFQWCDSDGKPIGKIQSYKIDLSDVEVENTIVLDGSATEGTGFGNRYYKLSCGDSANLDVIGDSDGDWEFEIFDSSEENTKSVARINSNNNKIITGGTDGYVGIEASKENAKGDTIYTDPVYVYVGEGSRCFLTQENGGTLYEANRECYLDTAGTETFGIGINPGNDAQSIRSCDSNRESIATAAVDAENGTFTVTAVGTGRTFVNANTVNVDEESFSANLDVYVDGIPYWKSGSGNEPTEGYFLHKNSNNAEYDYLLGYRDGASLPSEYTIPSTLVVPETEVADKNKSYAKTYSIAKINEEALYDIPEIKSVEVPSSVTNIGKHALGYDCVDDSETGKYVKVEGFTIKGHGATGAAKDYANDNNFKYIDLDYNPAPVGTRATVSSNQYVVTSDGGAQCIAPTSKKVKSVYLPATVVINGKTFAVTSVGYRAFYKCKKLTKVTIGPNITSIEKQAFYKSHKLKNVTIQTTSLGSVKSKAFKSTKSKITFKVPGANYKAYKNMIKKVAPKSAKYKKF